MGGSVEDEAAATAALRRHGEACTPPLDRRKYRRREKSQPIRFGGNPKDSQQIGRKEQKKTGKE